MAMFVATDDSSAKEAITLAEEVKELKANEDFLVGLKKKLESENKDLVSENDDLILSKEELSEQIAKLVASEQNLRDDVRGLERKLSEAKDDLVRAGSMAGKEKLESVKESVPDQPKMKSLTGKKEYNPRFPGCIESFTTRCITGSRKGGQNSHSDW